MLIAQIEGYTPLISHVLCMMNYARDTTIHALTGLSKEQLDHLQDEKSNSIGMLAMHIASVETWYQAFSFEGKHEFSNPADREKWSAAFDLGESAREKIKGYSAGDYIELLKVARYTTMREFQHRDDAWLLELRSIWKNPSNNYFLWFHVCEDEINHRGQMRWLRKRLPGI